MAPILNCTYPAGALAGFGGAVGVSNLKETRVGINLVWTPLEGFDIGRRVHVCAPQSDAAGWSRPGCGARRNRLAGLQAGHQPILDPSANPARVLKHRIDPMTRSQLSRSHACPNSPNKQGGPHRRLAIILAPRGLARHGCRVATLGALGALRSKLSMRSRSRLKLASMRPSNSRVRASLTRIGSTKWPFTMIS